jgi:CO/xanthine dehydrogenase FAD-binding subunit
MGYFSPTILPDALAALAGGKVKVIAGCTDFFPQLGDQKAPERLLDVSQVAELRGVSQTGDGWSIGAATTWSDLIHADLPPAFDGLKAAAREIGSVQIQNAGTIGGNLCNASPAADGVPPLLTLGAIVEVASDGGTRRLALSDFITGVRRIDLRPDELVVAIHIPALPQAAQSSFIKLGARKYLVISIAMVSALVVVDGDGRIELARVAVGSCSAVAQRLTGLEAALVGQDAAGMAQIPDIWSKNLAPLSPIGDVRASATYRSEAAAELCARAVFAAMKGRVDG